ncbi:flavin reductase family protein [Micromonospora okii]|uniref:flavin reductase family protein n=1 Tax=Micromonospora okii TaxID=1182970 RepID=UPI001E36A6FF|nr:flavin reductase family protein [Micromonospora okii]
MPEQAHPAVSVRAVDDASVRAIDDAGFRAAMSTLVAPVTVVTARDALGAPFGFTASAVVSLSLDPPLLLVCADRKAGSHDLLVAATHFCVNVMGADGTDLALRFGSHRADKFRDVEIEDSETGTPSLPVALSRIFCAVDGLRDGGDHTIVLGRVLSSRQATGEPLAWWNRGFQRLVRLT